MIEIYAIPKFRNGVKILISIKKQKLITQFPAHDYYSSLLNNFA